VMCALFDRPRLRRKDSRSTQVEFVESVRLQNYNHPCTTTITGPIRRRRASPDTGPWLVLRRQKIETNLKAKAATQGAREWTRNDPSHHPTRRSSDSSLGRRPEPGPGPDHWQGSLRVIETGVLPVFKFHGPTVPLARGQRARPRHCHGASGRGSSCHWQWRSALCGSESARPRADGTREVELNRQFHVPSLPGPPARARPPVGSVLL
jgi:hypothetical protein